MQLKSYSLSANLGYLFTEYGLIEAIVRSSGAGFQAVECQRPYACSPHDLRRVCEDEAIPMLAINTSKGEQGQFGLSALHDAIPQAQQAIDRAVEYAKEINVQYIHIMSGITSDHSAFDTLCQNINYALEKLEGTNVKIIIEPINSYSVPGYFMSSVQRARDVIEKINSDRVGIMFDCFHMLHITGSKEALFKAFKYLKRDIFHIQFASFPDRNEPNKNSFSYPLLFNSFKEEGYSGYFGAEYQPTGHTEDTLEWMRDFQV